MKERRMAAGTFQTHCLAVMDDVQSKREPVVITKRGKPVAKLVPADPAGDDIFNFMAGKITIVGDIVSPVIRAEEWKRLK
jgi:prevent-host-death family protein